MTKRRLKVVASLVLIGLGAAATLFWLTLPRDTAVFASANLRPLILSSLALIGLTSINLATRWFRWRFLLRRFKLNLRAKDSLIVWLMTLPAIATPFYLGELVRAGLLARRYPRSFATVAGVWLLERIADALVIGALLLGAQQRWQVLTVLLLVATGMLLGTRAAARAQVSGAIPWAAAVGLTLGSTLLAWTLPALGLWNVLRMLQFEFPLLDAIETFAIGTLLGGLTGIPAGVGVTGSTIIIALQAKGVGLEAAALAVAVFRAGTVWYALGLGAFAFLRWREHLAELLSGTVRDQHFDGIAADYDQNIPGHLNDRLVKRKTEIMRDLLLQAGSGQDWTGLDVGCGHGWYAGELADQGYSMCGCDLSIGQIGQARRNLLEEGRLVRLCVADAGALPYPDASFDFAFGVNVMHHIVEDDDRRKATTEIVRVLRPGGLFFLHEINTWNPLFRLYMGYVFPLLREIDEGTEAWVMPFALPSIERAKWQDQVQYFNFLPDFAPPVAVKWLCGLESRLERSRFRTWSSHYVACLEKDPAAWEPDKPHLELPGRVAA